MPPRSTLCLQTDRARAHIVDSEKFEKRSQQVSSLCLKRSSQRWRSEFKQVRAGWTCDNIAYTARAGRGARSRHPCRQVLSLVLSPPTPYPSLSSILTSAVEPLSAKAQSVFMHAERPLQSHTLSSSFRLACWSIHKPKIYWIRF